MLDSHFQSHFMKSLFTFYAFLVFVIALAEPEELEASNHILNNDSSDIISSSNRNPRILNDSNNDDEDNLLVEIGANPNVPSDMIQATLDASSDAPTFISDGLLNIKPAKATYPSSPNQLDRSKPRRYTLSELGDSLFNPDQWFRKGFEFIWGTEAQILRAEGNIVRSGAISIQGIVVYFAVRKRKLNGKEEISDEALQHLIENTECPDTPDDGYPDYELFCKIRIRGLPKKFTQVGHYARTVENVIPIFIDQVFNAKILDYHYIICYCCRGKQDREDGRGINGFRCTVELTA